MRQHQYQNNKKRKKLRDDRLQKNLIFIFSRQPLFQWQMRPQIQDWDFELLSTVNENKCVSTQKNDFILKLVGMRLKNFVGRNWIKTMFRKEILQFCIWKELCYSSELFVAITTLFLVRKRIIANPSFYTNFCVTECKQEQVWVDKEIVKLTHKRRKATSSRKKLKNQRDAAQSCLSKRSSS